MPVRSCSSPASSRPRPRALGALAATLVAALPLVASALPGRVTVSGMHRGATLTIEAAGSAIANDTRSYCSARLVYVPDDDKALAAGDTIQLTLHESDPFVGDDDLVAQALPYTVTAAEARARRVDIVWNCTSAFQSDFFGDELELYGKAVIDRESCGWFCSEPAPETEAAGVTEALDDDSEQDDTGTTARSIGGGISIGGRIAADADWKRVTLGGLGRIEATIYARADEGPLAVTLHSAGPSFAQVGVAIDITGGYLAVGSGLAAGTYYVRIAPLNGSDFNFYDMDLSIDADCECTDFDVEEEACGTCGTRSRSCGFDCQWEDWSSCSGEHGVCMFGELEFESCGRCGLQLRVCEDTCEWGAFDACEFEEGECTEGDTETAACDNGGTKTRDCQPGCAWGPYGSCVGGNNPDDTPDGGSGGSGGSDGGTGGGTVTCTPVAEICGDNVDNDCDGQTDEASVCGAPATPKIGDACERDGDCASGATCLEAPSVPTFVDGYCAVGGCSTDSTCPDSAKCVAAPGGEKACLKSCERDRDCRDGYVCVLAETGKRVCLGKCQNDGDCFLPDRPTCAPSTGRCGTAAMSGGGGTTGGRDGGTTGGRDGGTTGGSTGGGTSGATCMDDADCSLGQLCTNGRCEAGCHNDNDCPSGEACQSGQCGVSAGGSGGTGGTGGSGGDGAVASDGGGCASAGGASGASGLFALFVALAGLRARRRRAD